MKTKTTNKLAIIVISMLCYAGFGLQAQNADVAVVYDSYYGRTEDLSQLSKMDKDIRILENVLDEMFGGGRNSFINSRGGKGVHIPNSGVIFNVGGNGLFGTGYTSLDDVVVITQGTASNLTSGKEYTEEDLEKLNKEKEDKLSQLSKTFLANYGSLLTELKDPDKVQISCEYSLHVQSTSRKINGQYAYVASSRPENKRRLSAVATMKDLKDYASGKINESSIMSKITISKKDTDEKEMLDAKILAGIFDDLFSSSMSQTFSRSGSTNWSYFEGFGVMYNLNLSAHRSRTLFFPSSGNAVNTKAKDEPNAEEVKKEIEKSYAELEDVLKENLVKYGRTLRSLGSDEVIIMNVSLNGFVREADIPRSIQVVVNKKTIDAFSSGQRSLEQVKNEIDIKKLTSSVRNAPHGLVYERAQTLEKDIRDKASAVRQASGVATTVSGSGSENNK